MSPEPEHVPSVASKGGRPKKPKTSVVNVRIPDHIYDAYCKTSIRTDIDVRTIMRQVLTFYAPKA